jgi:thioredoxin reductase (NADPH)
VSINDIGLDHYLMKPWDPPEQKLYPVLDDLLSEWRARVKLPYDGLRIVGSRWSPQSFEVKEFLSRNQVPYQWIDVDQDESMSALASSLGNGELHLPTVLLPDGSHLLAPTVRDLADKVGLHTKATRPFYDLVVIGAGPAGLANALYGASEGLHVLLIEQNAPGGQAGTSSMIENYLGFPAGVTGADLAQRATAQARRFGVEILTAQEVVGLRREDPYRIVKLADGSEVSAYAVVIATGMSVRKLDVPGVDPLIGIGVYYGAAMTEAATYRKQDVCIVGGANSAGQGALFFSRYARKVTMLVRAKALGPSMSRYLVERIEKTPNIEIINLVEVTSVSGEGKLEHVTLKQCETGEARTIDVSAMFIFIGVAPRSEMFASVLARDEKGFILTGEDLPRVSGKPRDWTLDRDPYLFETAHPRRVCGGRRARQRESARGRSGRRGISGDLFGPSVLGNRLEIFVARHYGACVRAVRNHVAGSRARPLDRGGHQLLAHTLPAERRIDFDVIDRQRLLVRQRIIQVAEPFAADQQVEFAARSRPAFVANDGFGCLCTAHFSTLFEGIRG